MILVLNDIDNEENVSEHRVIEYATHRVEANPEDGFSIPKTLEEAIYIIRCYDEDVLF